MPERWGHGGVIPVSLKVVTEMSFPDSLLSRPPSTSPEVVHTELIAFSEN
jgi:hypothetical protein